MLKRSVVLLLLIVITACESDQPTTSIATTEEPTQSALVATAVPTAGPLFATSTPSNTPTITLTPTVTPTLTYTVTATATVTLTPTLTPIPPTSTPERFVDHFYFARPIASGGTDRLDRTYAYGSTQNGRRQTHLGVEFQNPRGTPVLAVAGGTVYYAGTDADNLFGPSNNYYGNVVVIEHGVRSVEGRPVYTLYAHLDQIDLETGQMVEQGDRIGRVGDSGIAEGSHLHFEVRVGDPENYLSTRNPDLWLYPQFDEGVIAGRVVDVNGDLVYDEDIQIRRNGADTITYETYTYAEEIVNASESWGENFTRGDLRDGEYEIVISTDSGTVLYRGTVTIESGETAWIDIQLTR